MDTTPLDKLRNGAAHGDIGDEKMEQIRELLYGDIRRRQEARLGALEARLREMELRVERRLDALEARMAALSGEVTGERRTAFDQLAQGIADLGERVKRLSRT